MNEVIVMPARAWQFPVKVEMPQFSAALARLEAQGLGRANFKVLVREAAKRHPLYHTPVQLDPQVAGRSDQGEEIPVNTLGRWLFGVPGYQGNARFVGWDEVPHVELPEDCPVHVVALLQGLSLGAIYDALSRLLEAVRS